MIDQTDDLLWPHFSPLWKELSAASPTGILVAGGYGLFLKQQWLVEADGPATVVPMQNWDRRGTTRDQGRGPGAWFGSCWQPIHTTIRDRRATKKMLLK